MRKVGYYCNKNSKTDYNTSDIDPAKIRDECSNTAQYKNRPSGKPFFAVLNLNTSHENCFHQSIPVENLRHHPQDIIIAPYHPDTREIRHDYAYKEVVERMQEALTSWMKDIKDVGLIPETDYDLFSGDKSMYDSMHSDVCPFDQLIAAMRLRQLCMTCIMTKRNCLMALPGTMNMMP